jgi:large subunit ribosomal protein L10
VNREQKVAAVAELQERFARASVALVASNLGLTVEQSNSLRTSLKAVGGEYKVAKHTLTRLAIEQTKYEGLRALLEGPRNLVFGYDDPVAVAKALVEFAAQNNKLEIDGGALEGQVLPAEQVKALASMPDVGTLQARVARQALAPASRLASTIVSPAQRIAGAIEALVKKLAEEGAGA